MKKFTRIAAGLLAVALAATMAAGCSKQGSGSKDSDKFYIGGIGPTTGGAAVYGNAVKNAAQIAVDEINEAG